MKNTIIISIKPKYIEKIFSGEKRWEYRKSFPDGVEAMLIYATAPIKKIVGIAFVEKVMRAYGANIWMRTKGYGGISMEEFMKYANNNTICAVKMNSVWRLSEPIDLKFRPPQSYMFSTAEKHVDIVNNEIVECWSSKTFDPSKIYGWEFLSGEGGVTV